MRVRRVSGGLQGLLARLAGGGEREVGTGREIELDASGSRDPDVDADKPQACILYAMCPSDHSFIFLRAPCCPFLSNLLLGHCSSPTLYLDKLTLCRDTPTLLPSH